MKQEHLLVLSSSPHIHSSDKVPTAMRDVLIALIPALVVSVYFFGLPALSVIASCVVFAVLSELAAQKIMKKEISVRDGSAVITGLLLAFTLPPSLPVWIAAIGSIAAIIIGKQLFGGLGNNIFNPALIGRAFLLASWPVAMTTWTPPLDAVTSATPMALLKEGAAQLPSIAQLFFGNVSGSLGETSALALLIGGLYLMYRGHVDWRIPCTYMGTVFVLTGVFAAFNGYGIWYPLYHLFGGGLVLGAFFMATDWVTSPITKRGRIVFGVGLGLLTVIIRLKGGYPEGVCYSILLMNMVTPLIDRYTKSRIFGGVKKHA